MKEVQESLRKQPVSDLCFYALCKQCQNSNFIWNFRFKHLFFFFSIEVSQDKNKGMADVKQSSAVKISLQLFCSGHWKTYSPQPRNLVTTAIQSLKTGSKFSVEISDCPVPLPQYKSTFHFFFFLPYFLVFLSELKASS